MANMLNLNKRERVIAIVAALSILLALYSITVLAPCVTAWSDLSKAIHEKTELLRANRALVGRKDELNAELSHLSKGVLARLPSGRKESEFLAELDRVAQETSVHIRSMHTRPSRDLDYFRELSVEIDMEANLGNLVRFLYLMRKSSVVLVADKLRLEPKSKRSALLRGHVVVSTIFTQER